MIKFRCPQCGQKIGVKKSKAGGMVKCPTCSHACAVPSAVDAAEDTAPTPAPPAVSREPADRDPVDESRAPASSTPPPRKAREWFYTFNDKQVGPAAVEVIAAMLEKGVLTDSSKVWTEGMDGWKAIRSVDEFRDIGEYALDEDPQWDVKPQTPSDPIDPLAELAKAAPVAPARARPALAVPAPSMAGAAPQRTNRTLWITLGVTVLLALGTGASVVIIYLTAGAETPVLSPPPVPVVTEVKPRALLTHEQFFDALGPQFKANGFVQMTRAEFFRKVGEPCRVAEDGGQVILLYKLLDGEMIVTLLNALEWHEAPVLKAGGKPVTLSLARENMDYAPAEP